ncbi:acetyltransferase [Eremomyces bilateralis CBS 781.70]|uniref:Acetyltransferase n=1 Tax=Eremomyces bilateralis CBS 781.70 TaxID=1392243 RepID=A0A6G1G0U7_9PEZI|nr:acetyltransferase [Eremomyces bilateralis CBS 781.70]KAF1811663.1 acetyltransferase [Eremomyces bilateralis CBS 781.70]
MAEKLDFTLRPANESDCEALTEILEHYVHNTLITFRLEAQSEDEVRQGYNNVIASGLPYIVAIDAHGKNLGCASVSGFRGAKGGYMHTVELTLFCHPDHIGQGVGSALLTQLIDILKNPERFPEYIPVPRDEDTRIRQVIACMSLNETGRGGGWGLARFYESFGFKQVGHLKQVGHKHGQWYGFG